MKILLCGLIICSAALAQTSNTNGNGVGNGGDVVICEKSSELLDFSEAKLLKTFTLASSEKKSYLTIAQERVQKLRRLNPKLYEQYSKVLGKIEKRLQFIKGASFRDVPDSFEIALPKGCQIHQIAIQQNIEGVTQIHISKDLWDRLDEENRAGLILHEIIYEHFLAFGERNSVKARKMNALLFSKEIDSYSVEKFREFLKKNEIKAY